MRHSVLLVFSLVFFINLLHAQTNAFNFTGPEKGTSFYQQPLEDSDAVYFIPGRYSIAADGSRDVSDELQQAIAYLKSTHNFGILFIPEGKYLISKTIYVPQGIRLIGYGANRPVIKLANNSPGFHQADSTDKGEAKYMFWFTSNLSQPGKPINDAGAGTFYSAMVNINLQIGDGNPAAVALRTHYAQHSFIAHVDVDADGGKAGMFDVGNYMEDVRFFGGDYGIYTTKPSPGWQFMMVDTYFEGQRKAAIQSREGGLTIVRLHAKNVPEVIDVMPNFHEELFMEDSRFENVTGPAITISVENNASNQVSLRNVVCNNVPVFIKYRQSGNQVAGSGAIYRVKNYMHGLQMDSLRAEPVIKAINETEVLTAMPTPVEKDIPTLPAANTWVNLKQLGAIGDGITDDTKAIQAAIDKYPNIYVPQGWYRVTETIKLKPNTMLWGLTPIGTQFILADNTEAFGSFGGPKALLESSEGGKNIVSGIGLSTGADNPRAVACKWMAGPGSWFNDVKFVGGHGGMARIWKQPDSIARKEVGAYRFGNAVDPAWDSQYWSLWVTKNGTGTFTDIWTASTYASAGTYVSNTSLPGHIYAMSVEHHVRNEVRFNNVTGWKVYALQLEEESREGTECQPLELQNCHNMVFGNLYMFRVIRIVKPYPYSIRNWGSSNIEFLNVHNYSQIKYTTSNPLYDVNTNTTIRPWEFNRLWIGKAAYGFQGGENINGVQQLATGFEFAEGACADSKGNVYFGESRLRRIYKWSVDTKSLSMVADYHWDPLSLACDKNDNLLVVFKYTPKKGYTKNGKEEMFNNPPDAWGTSFSGWGNSGFATWVYSINPNNPDETIQLLPTVPMGSIANIYKALYPAHRWRDGHDFNTVTVNRPTECFTAPDGVTIIPIVYDLARSACLSEAFPGKPVYVSNEYEKSTVKLDVDAQGYVSNLTPFAEKGEFSIATDAKGNVYIADGQVYMFNSVGKQLKVIDTPERPTTLTFGGKDHTTLYITTAGGLYSKKVE